MKFILSALLFMVLSTAHARDLVCMPAVIKEVKAEVVARAKIKKSTDKNKHCAVSCILSLRCRASSVLILGIGKEFYDSFTPGDADLADMKADYQGIDLAKSGRARNKTDCFTQCDSYYR